MRPSTGRRGTIARQPSAQRQVASASSTRSSTSRRRVIAQRGYHATSTTELCEANELGKGALYYYIGSKEQLLVAIHDRVMDEVLPGADRVERGRRHRRPERLTMLGDELLDVIARYPDHVWVFLHEFPALTGDNATQFRARRREYEHHVEAVLEAGIESGDFRQLDPKLTARAWLGMHNYTYLWLKAGGSCPRRRSPPVRRHLHPRHCRQNSSPSVSFMM